ncbi:reprolysin-like metallopeptidase [Candidatus Leptofilum sp.]|uniref:reprolysin-like metallopeptidase n=1 Tax=Candidatus Leptofilum sp. TaxID=3241576 RepID=UPI003B5CBA19
MIPTNQKNNYLLFFIGLVGLTLLLIFLTIIGRQSNATAAPTGTESADGVWQDVDESLLRVAGDRVIEPTAYRTVSLNWDALDGVLANSPDGATVADETVLSLPLPDGSYGRFQIYQTAVMHPELAAKFPEIRTYAGVGLDDPTAFARLDTTPKGFHAMILSANGRVFIDPYVADNTDLYQSYFASDFIPNLPDDFEPDVVVEPEHEEGEKPAAPDGGVSSGSTLRTYRLAVAATGEYTQFHGGEELAMAEIVTAINRVTGIYEREVAVRLELIANNDLIIYPNGATDPYTDNNGFAMLSENQTNLDTVIESANYDIGHVFSTNGGGVATLGVPCVSGLKARGVTGLSSPIGDPFYVDYVAHEIGHQFAANHTFNSNTGFCNEDFQWNADTAYEPGSGSTIMAYAGICSPQNLQSNSDDYFHGISFDEIVAYTTVGNGNSCAVTSSTGNTPPTVNAGGSYNIPLNTPFTLTGSASDPDGTASLTYNWEQFDNGSQGVPQFPSGNAPIFRSFPATTSPSRTFPQISDIVNNMQTLGEILPSYGRTMNFRLTVRDNNAATGGVASDSTTVTAVAGTGPFLVTSPNTNVTWTGNTTETVTWNVAGTTDAPISCANVNIDLSTDGGFTYPTVLEMNTPNDGSQNVIVPNISTSNARVRVSCADNIFFDISNTNFTIQIGAGGDPSLTVSKSVEPTGSVIPGDSLTYTIDVENVGTAPASNTVVTDTFATALTNPSCNGVSGDLMEMVAINPSSSESFTCTAVVDSSLALDVEITALPSAISSTEITTYTITVTNSHGSLSLNNVQVATTPNLINCTPALNTPQVLGPGASQVYTCPNNGVTLPGSVTATATGELTISNVAQASDEDDPGGVKSSSTVQNQVIVTGSDNVMVMVTDYYYIYLPTIMRD